LQVLFQNDDGLSPMDKGEVKLTMFQQMINQLELDIVGITETKTCWDLVDYNLCLPQKTRGWWEIIHWLVGFNQTNPHQLLYQPGGMGLMAVNGIAHQIQLVGKDETGMGCWCWTQIHGKGNSFTRFVSLYQPCKSRGPRTTYQQQVQALTKKAGI